MSLDGSPLPVDLGGRRSQDVIDFRGLPVFLGPLEDPLLHWRPFPEESVSPGESRTVVGPPAAGMNEPVMHTFTYVGPLKDAQGSRYRVRWESQCKTRVTSPSPGEIVWRQSATAELDSEDMSFDRIKVKSRHIEIYNTPSGPQTVTQNRTRTIRRTEP